MPISGSSEQSCAHHEQLGAIVDRRGGQGGMFQSLLACKTWWLWLMQGLCMCISQAEYQTYMQLDQSEGGQVTGWQNNT